MLVPLEDISRAFWTANSHGMAMAAEVAAAPMQLKSHVAALVRLDLWRFACAWAACGCDVKLHDALACTSFCVCQFDAYGTLLCFCAWFVLAIGHTPCHALAQYLTNRIT
jgi:hypothetical protein